MKSRLFYFLALVIFLSACGNKKSQVNKKGVESDKIQVFSAVLDEYGKLMPRCKNIVKIDVKDFNIEDALVYIDNDEGDALIQNQGIVLIPYNPGKDINLIVSFEDKGGSKKIGVSEKIPAPVLKVFDKTSMAEFGSEIERIIPAIVKISADEKFAKLFPEDAQYFFKSYEIILKNQNGAVIKNQKVEDYESDVIDLSDIQKIAVQNSTLEIIFTKVVRKDFEGNLTDVDLNENSRILKLTIK
ncbi:MAG: hypothetical protein WHW07_06070 [Bacteroidales bacterium]|jgi:hypothetical protein|nr:hypothetical protein [Bacteroidales bacterium]HOL97072.1 hypothetical protein [Bacteroidales bacterium]HOM35981.1 hypothetical protein [Bacteroidales bacterium]HPD23405.1 hypothetical protein [Bacteroidales bacterium]HRS99427.1 hypothetical protein [Bacteroidales bacterium]